MSRSRPRFLILFVIVFAACNQQAQTQTPAQDVSPQHLEEAVRSTYGALTFLAGVAPVAKAAEDELWSKRVPSIQVPAPRFEIKDIQTGTVASIADRKLTDFVDIPNGEVLQAQSSSRYFTEGSTSATWEECSVSWKAFTYPDTSVRPSVAVAADREGRSLTDPATLTHYAAFTVIASFDGKSTGPYKALFFFGHDTKGAESIVEEDQFVRGLGQVLFESVYPSQLTVSRLRETPTLAAWIKANTVSDSSCSSARVDVCCHDGQCGLAESRVGRDLSIPFVIDPLSPVPEQPHPSHP